MRNRSVNTSIPAILTDSLDGQPHAANPILTAGGDGREPLHIHSRRTPGGRREYRRDTLRAIAFIRAAQRVGVSLERIKEALDQLPDQGVPTKRDWARISRHWRDDMTRRIEELIVLRDRFSDCIGCGCLSLRSCPYSNPDDVLGRDGPGARRFP